MSILIDPPRWPAHGTVFSHLVSDSSVAELKDFARQMQLPDKAFDKDHYDVPLRRYNELVAAGAQEVTGGELVRALVASGLRIPARFRPEKLNAVLTSRWERTLPGQSQLGADLLERWSQEHRRYHDRVHLLAVLEALDWLCEKSQNLGPTHTQELRLAAWYHDAVYVGTASDEQDSAALAAAQLSDIMPQPSVRRICDLILMTAEHLPEATDESALILSDADLEGLARPETAYLRYTVAIREEYAHVPQTDFARGRASILGGLLAKKSIFATPAGRERWEAQAQHNVQHEYKLLHRQLVS